MNRQPNPEPKTGPLTLKELHGFEKFGRHLVFDIEAMRLYQVNGLAREILDHAENRSPLEVMEALALQYPRRQTGEVLAQLMQLGLVAYKPLAVADEPLEPAKKPGGIARAVLYVSQDCNLACRYCLTRGGGNIVKQHMSEAVARAAVDLLIAESGQCRHLTLGFYGGEPLLNVKCIKAIVPYARQQAARHDKEITFTLTTNGTLLTRETADFIAEHDIRVLLSVDGSREGHDANRIYPDGSGTFDRVMKGLDLLKEKTGGVAMLTVARTGKTRMTELARTLLDLGAPPVQIAPAISPKGRLDNGDGEEDREDELVDRHNHEYEEMTAYFLENGGLEGDRPVMDFSRLFALIDQRTPVQVNCSAGYGRIAVDPEGNILPCDNFIGLPEFYMGNVLDGMAKHHQNTFKRARASASPVCSSCWARPLCGGWCPYFSYLREGRTDRPAEPFCRMSRGYLETALGVYSVLKSRAEV